MNINDYAVMTIENVTFPNYPCAISGALEQVIKLDGHMFRFNDDGCQAYLDMPYAGTSDQHDLFPFTMMWGSYFVCSGYLLHRTHDIKITSHNAKNPRISFDYDKLSPMSECNY